jgi:integrator complex subunit 8
MAKLCMELNRSTDRVMQKKVARDIWDIMIDLYTDATVLQKSRQSTPPSMQQQQQQQQQQQVQSKAPPLLQLPGQPYDASNTAPPQSKSTSPVNVTSPPSQQQSAARDLHLLQTNRQFIANLLLWINNRQIRNIVVSMLTSIYNVVDTMANNEIKSELKYLWPTSINQVLSFNLNAFPDLMTKYLINTVEEFTPFNSSWNRVVADVSVAKSLSSDAIKYYLKFFLLETRNFFRNKQLIETNSNNRFDEKILKLMIKAMVTLNKHTHAAVMCQMLLNNNEYTAAFRYLQEGNVLVPTADDTDMIYDCIWDMALLEYLVNLNTIRGYMNKKCLLMKLIAMQNVNASNPSETYAKTVEFKKARMFQKLVYYYLL